MTSRYTDLLRQQIRHEFTASQQYIALGVWFDAHDLPQLARHFYRQSVEERNHAMMMIQYMLDRDIEPEVSGVDEVRGDFETPRDLVALALAQEETVTGQIEAIFRAARDEGDFIGEQFILWFLKEQVEEVASMKTLLTICDRAGTNWFLIEDFLARERVGDGGSSVGAPGAAGGIL